jgi:ParB-like chromosome segregation protein Spo0J
MKTMNLKAIRTDGGTQQRASISEDTVMSYADLIREGAEFPPVTVFFDGEDTWLADGHHRYLAHEAAGKASIQVHMIPGSQRDAILYSVSANASHGLARTQEDKRKAVKTILEDFEWSDWSDREIARKAAVSLQLVQAVKHEHEKGERVSSRVMNNKGTSKAKKDQVKEPVIEVEDDGMQEAMSELLANNEKLADRLAVAAMEATEEEKKLAEETITELRERIRVLEIELQSVKISRDQFQAENAEMKKQIAALNRKVKKAE